MRRAPDRAPAICAVALAPDARRRVRDLRHTVRRRVRAAARPVGCAPPPGPPRRLRLTRRAPMLPTDQTSLRLAARITIAAMAAYLVGIALGLPGAFWAVITALFVVQMSVGGTIGAGLDRLVGTVVGAAVGGVALVVHHVWPQIPVGLLFLAAIAPLSLFAVKKPSYRIAPITAAVMLLIVHDMGQPIAMAFDRVIEIAIGCVIGVAVSILVLPYRAEQQLVDRVAAGLRLLAQLAATLLETRDAAHLKTLDGLNERMRGLLASCEATAADVQREHRLHLSGRRDPEPLFRTMRRLRSDMAIIDRAVTALGEPNETPVPPEAERLTATIAQFFGAAADAMVARQPPPPFDAMDAAIAARFATPVPDDLMPLSFAITALRRDCGDLYDRLAERAAE